MTPLSNPGLGNTTRESPKPAGRRHGYRRASVAASNSRLRDRATSRAPASSAATVTNSSGATRSGWPDIDSLVELVPHPHSRPDWVAAAPILDDNALDADDGHSPASPLTPCCSLTVENSRRPRTAYRGCVTGPDVGAVLASLNDASYSIDPGSPLRARLAAILAPPPSEAVSASRMLQQVFNRLPGGTLAMGTTAESRTQLRSLRPLRWSTRLARYFCGTVFPNTTATNSPPARG